MKLAEILTEARLDYKDRPTIELDKITVPFDPEILADMIETNQAKLFINGWDLSDICDDAGITITQDALATEASELNVTDDCEIDDVDGDFTKMFYSVKDAMLYVEYDFKVSVSAPYSGSTPSKKRNKGSFRTEGIASIEVLTEKKLAIKPIGSLPKDPDIVDMTKLYKDCY